ncbi:hypothetical protein CICLE_v10013561mg [Citrus x clementina]|uniref:Uncharacterized protein n=1 Tax=Citrus clementina TaxID=85681 RepID=V4SYY7_CITCL|nr:hypothetical protein CICLE_v10013561mg [Citrus x clementina]
MDPHDVDGEDKADWSSRTETAFIPIMHDHVKKVTTSEPVWAGYIKKVSGVKPYRKKSLEHYQTLGEIFNTTTASGHLCFSSNQVPLSSNEDRELKTIFLVMEFMLMLRMMLIQWNHFPRVRQKKGFIGQLQNHLSVVKNKKSEFDNYFKMASSVMNARLKMVKCKSTESTSQCVEKWYIEECIEAVEKLRDVNGDTYNKLMDKLVPNIE